MNPLRRFFPGPVVSRSGAGLAVLVAAVGAASQARAQTSVSVLTPIDLNADRRVDFYTRIVRTQTAIGPMVIEESQWTLVPVDPANAWYVKGQTTLLAAGDPIGSPLPTGEVWVTGERPLFGAVVGPGGNAGGLLLQGAGYLGVRFSAADGEHHGWLRYEVRNLGFIEVILREWAAHPVAGKTIAAGEVPLGITRVGQQLLLSWSLAATNLTLQASPRLESPSWQPVPGVVSNSVALPAGDSARYFRLLP